MLHFDAASSATASQAGECSHHFVKTKEVRRDKSSNAGREQPRSCPYGPDERWWAQCDREEQCEKIHITKTIQVPLLEVKYPLLLLFSQWQGTHPLPSSPKAHSFNTHFLSTCCVHHKICKLLRYWRAIRPNFCPWKMQVTHNKQLYDLLLLWFHC